MKTAFHGAFSILVFLFAIIGQYALAKGARARIPVLGWRVHLSFGFVPWVAACVLLVFQAITFQDVGAALVGKSTPLSPLSLASTYLSLAYLSGSCEVTGLYAWLALHAARRTRHRPLLLLATIFGCSGALAALTNADTSLIVLTPVLVYTASCTCLDPMTLAATHLGAASVCSMLSPVAGLGNMLAAQAFQLTFVRFVVWMLLPTLAAAGVVFSLLYLLLHRRRMRYYVGMLGSAPFPDPGILLHDQVGAALSSAALVCCLLALAVAPSLRWAGWAVAAVFAGLVALYNAAASAGPLRGIIGRRGGYERRRRFQAEMAKQGLRPALSDEDLADLLLSAAQQRQASFTRLAAAAATATSVAAPGSAAPAQLQRQPSGSSSRRSSGRGFARRASNSSLGSGSISLASMPSVSAGNTGASGGGAGGASSGGAAGAPVRRWFSRQWSLGRRRPVPPSLGAELLAAASAAGSDLRILAACTGEGLPGAPTSGGGGNPGRADFSSGGGGPARPAGAADTAAAASAASVRVSVEFQQLLTQGTGAAPDWPDWWAAAAAGAEQLLRTRGVASTCQPSSQQPMPVGVGDCGVAADEARPGSGAGSDLAHDPLLVAEGGRVPAACGASNGRDLTAESAFAAASAMDRSRWDGRLESASVGAPAGTARADSNCAAVHEAPPPPPPPATMLRQDAKAAGRPQPQAAASPQHSQPQPLHIMRQGRFCSVGMEAYHGSDTCGTPRALHRPGPTHGPSSVGQSPAGQPARAGSFGPGRLDEGPGKSEGEAPDTWAADRSGGAGCVVELTRCKSGAEGRRQPLRATPRGGATLRGAEGAAAPAPGRAGAISSVCGEGSISSAGGAGPPDRARRLDQQLRPASEHGMLPGSAPAANPPAPLSPLWQPLSPRCFPLHCASDGAGGAAAWPSTPEGPTEAEEGPDPSQPRRTRSSAAGLESLFACWMLPPRQGDAAESVALLPPRVAASDDPCHAHVLRQGSNQPDAAAVWGSVPPSQGGCGGEMVRISASGGRPLPPLGSEPLVVAVDACGGGSSWAQRRGWPPSLDLLLFGPSEVSFLGTLAALPWAHAVHLLGMCVLVEALQVHGWLDALTSALDAMAAAGDPIRGHERSTAHSGGASAATVGSSAAASAVFAVGWLSAGLAVAITGQGAVLLLARAMLRPEFLAGSAGGAAARRGAQLALVVAAGMAPALSLSGSLTALRWGLGLRQLGVRLRCCRHMVSGLAPAALSGTMAALLVLWGLCAAAL